MFKKIVLIVAVLLSLVISCAKIAYAENAYADTDKWVRILTDDVYLYTESEAKQELFLLEKSYYVNIIEETDSMYRVAVMPQNSPDFVQIIGWVKKGDVSVCKDQPIEPIYPTKKLTVTADSVDLKQSPLPSAAASCAILNLQEVCYYGTVESYGKTWYYVRYAGRYGYVDANALSKPDIPLHPTPLPSTPSSTLPTTPPTDTTPDPTPGKNSPASEILLIVFIVLLAVGLTLALFLPGNVKKHNNVFEQDI